jgi:hypothetical protein
MVYICCNKYLNIDYGKNLNGCYFYILIKTQKMDKEEIFNQADEYANANWSVIDKPNEHDNARDDFAAGALWAIKKMEINQKLIAEYSQTGHPEYPEDTWSDERTIENVEDLFQYMKDLHRRDAHSFIDFPFNGSCGMNCFSFSIEKWVEVKGEKYICEQRVKVEAPEYFNDAKKLYETFCDRMKRTLPKLRKASENKRKEKQEKAKLAKLQAKYSG